MPEPNKSPAEEARSTLVRFLEGVGAGERLIGFVSKRKTQGKFLDLLHHRFDGCVHPSVLGSGLPESAWSSSALVFTGSGSFGERFDTLEEAWRSSDVTQGVLAITASGSHGIWMDHHGEGDPIYIALAR